MEALSDDLAGIGDEHKGVGVDLLALLAQAHRLPPAHGGEHHLLVLVGEGPLAGKRLLVKRHPDDPLEYRQVFPGAEILSQPFPAELLPWAFRGRRPRQVWAFGSAALANLGESFSVTTVEPTACPPLVEQA